MLSNRRLQGQLVIGTALALCLHGCRGSTGGDGIVGPPPIVPRSWGPIPPGPRLPGEPAPASYQPVIQVMNQGPDRTETLRASVPFPWGRVANVNDWSVSGAATAWLVLQKWPDGTARVAQAQWTQSLLANEQRTFDVVPSPTLSAPFTPHAAFTAGLPLFGAEVRDTFGVSYRAMWQEPAEALQETALVRVRRVRGYHQAIAPGTGIGRDYLTSTFYLTEFHDQPVVLVDWLLGNDYRGADNPQASTDPNLYPLGGIDLRAAMFLQRGADVALPYRATTEDIAPATITADGFTAWTVLPDTFLGDGQTRRYRFLLLRDDPAATPATRAAARVTAVAMMEQPLQPLCTQASWRTCHALGLLGGPIAPPPDAALRASVEWNDWSGGNHFGAFGSRGDPVATGQTGTPRNGPLSPEVVHAVQSRDPRLLVVLEQKAWTQAMRPYHLYRLRVENQDDIVLWDGVPMYPGSRDLSRESLGRRALLANDPYPGYRTMVQGGPQHAHGFEPFDPEHWSMDLVFDYWTVSGDAWAREELRQLGESLRGLMRPRNYFTSVLQSARAEGWTMQGLVQAFVATGDIRFRDFALDRLHDIVDRDRPIGHVSGALKIEDGDARTGFPQPHRHYMPWQHGAVLHGYLAGWKFFGDPLYLRICEGVAQCVEHAWVRNWQDPRWGPVSNGLRYYVPVEFDNAPVLPSVFDNTVGVVWGDSPLGGAHSMLLGLLLLGRTSDDPLTRARAEEYGDLLLRRPIDDDDRWNKWFSVVPAEFDH